MPHIPRRIAPTTGVSAAYVMPPREHTPTPLPAAPEEKPRPKQSLGLERISPHTYKPDEARFLATLFGKEPDVDPYTGELVPAQPAPAGPATGGHLG